MKQVLIGAIMDGKAGGIDRYILNLFRELNQQSAEFDFFTNQISEPLQKDLQAQGADLFQTAGFAHPVRQYRDFKKIFSHKKYDTAYFNLSTAIGFVGPYVAKRCGVEKIVIHSHTTGCDISNPYKRKLMTVIHRISRLILYRFGTDFYACSKEAGDWMFPKRIVSGASFQIVKNAIHTQNFVLDEDLRAQMREQLGLEDCFVVGHVGNFVYQKNHAFLLRVFSDVSKVDAAARLLLVGDGALFEETKAQAANLGIADKVLFAGRRTDANLYMQAMDAFAFPSNFEGLGIVAIEAQAAGLPCICSDRVPQEAHITDLCMFLPIEGENAAADWVSALQKAKEISRSNRADEIIASGYDLQSQDLKQLV
ncbi:MAG: glycosyltransferase [Candidatus Fimenecus sp.]